MVDDIEQEAYKMLGKLDSKDKQAPVKIYKLAQMYNLMVLIQSDSISSDKMPTSTVIEHTMMNYIFDNKIPWGYAKFYLLLSDKDPISRRTLTASAIAKIQDDPFVAVWPIANLQQKEPKVYELALCLLIPYESLVTALTQYNLSVSDALNTEWVIEKLSNDFLVYKIDVVNRLKLLED